MSIWLAEIWRAWRASLRRPGFLLLTAGVLALGVGVATAVFSMVDGLLLRPLPYSDPQRLVAMGCPKVQLMERPDNEAARGFYDALGYEPFQTWDTGKRLIPDV